MFWACRGAELPAASSCLLNHTLHTLHSSDSYWHTAYVLCPPSFTPSLLHFLSVPVSSFRRRDSGSWLISAVFRIHLPPFTTDLKRQFTKKSYKNITLVSFQTRMIFFILQNTMKRLNKLQKGHTRTIKVVHASHVLYWIPTDSLNRFKWAKDYNLTCCTLNVYPSSRWCVNERCMVCEWIILEWNFFNDFVTQWLDSYNQSDFWAISFQTFCLLDPFIKKIQLWFIHKQDITTSVAQKYTRKKV